MNTKKILVIGASGMLGNAVTRYLINNNFLVTGTVRSIESINSFPDFVQDKIIYDLDINEFENVIKLIKELKPDVVINCVGVVKQLSNANDPLLTLPINSLFPHKLAQLCANHNIRVIHISTDCVFSGLKGGYTEDDIPDATDLYGISKKLGEVDYPNAITLRTSIIGHELEGNRSLIDWFLSQKQEVEGYQSAIFSGLPTVEIARIIKDFVIPNKKMRGVYHVSAEPINKYDLLKLVSEIYGHEIKITKSTHLKINRSLDSSRFRKFTGFVPESWVKMIHIMKDFH